MGKSKRSFVPFLILGSVACLIGMPLVYLPVFYISTMVTISKASFPVKGQEIDQNGYCSDHFSVDGQYYYSLGYQPTSSFIKDETVEAEAVFTYSYWYGVGGYYYQIMDDLLPFDLIVSDNGDSFTKEEDLVEASQYYQDIDVTWELEGVSLSDRISEEEGKVLEGIGDLAVVNDKIIKYTDVSDSIYNLKSVSADGYLYIGRYRIVEYQHQFYRQRTIVESYTDNTESYAILLPEEIQSILLPLLS
ncbi:MAG: hypothetical protein WCR67_01005 [Bacilli bacterium]